jgi:hypothetical protein
MHKFRVDTATDDVFGPSSRRRTLLGDGVVISDGRTEILAEMLLV